YGLDSEIRYNDAIDDTYVSDPMKVTIDVANLTGIQAIVSSPIDITVLIAVILGIVYAILRFRKKRQ
ncbi:MAG: S-layer protein, partial [Methanoregula sp.]